MAQSRGDRTMCDILDRRCRVLGRQPVKFVDGGWCTLVIAAIVFTVIEIWRSGMQGLKAVTRESREPMEKLLLRLAKDPPARIPGTAVFMTSSTSETPALLLHHLEHNRVLHERVILVTVVTEDKPRVMSGDRLEVENLNLGFHRAIVRYDFMQTPNVPVALRLCERFGLAIEPSEATFYLGHEEVVLAPGTSGLARLRTQLLASSGATLCARRLFTRSHPIASSPSAFKSRCRRLPLARQPFLSAPGLTPQLH